MDAREELIQLMEERGISLTAVARAIGHSTATMCQWHGGNYPGNKKNIEKAVKAFLERFKERVKDGLKIPYILNFIETTVSKRVFEVARICHIEGEIGICYGPAGVGKTVAIKEYSDRNMDVVLVEADPSYASKALFSDVHKKLKMGGGGSLREMFEDIVERLKGSGRMVVIDEAEYLPHRSLELLRRVHDKAEVGLLLVGMPRIHYIITKEKGNHPQISSRIGVSANVGSLKPQDTEAIVNSLLPSTNGLWKTYHDVSYGNTRVLSKLLARSIRLSEINNIEVSAEVIRDAAKMLII